MKTAYQLDTMGLECPFIAPKPTHGISEKVVKKAVRDWMNRGHKKPS
jgi:hypothetical protein